MSDESQVAEAAEAEREARRNGWVPRDEWKGRPEQWADAPTFLERANTFVPFLKAEGKKLREELQARDRQIAELTGTVKALNTSVTAINDSREEDIKAAREEERALLQNKIEQASEAGDHKALAEATADLSAHDAKVAAETAAASKKELGAGAGAGTGAPLKLDPEAQAWITENQEFLGDMRQATLANGIAAELRSKGDKRLGKAFLDDVKQQTLEALGRAPSRTEDGKTGSGSGGGGRSSSGNGKSYSDLPAEAKQVCDRQAARLVGPGRRHKTVESWRASYAEQYFKE